MATYLRIKLTVNSRKAKGKGVDMLTRRTQTIRNYDQEFRTPVKDSKRRGHV
jgi:hypothetical protein